MTALTTDVDGKTREFSPISEIFQTSIDAAHALKESGTRDIDPHYDINPIVEFHGDDGMLLAFIPERCDKRDAIAAAHITLRMLDACEYLIVHMDAHVATEMTNPATGQRWAPGEMQKACDEDGACSLGLITDCINSMLVRRDGTIHMVMRTYHVNEDKREVHWKEVQSSDEATITRQACTTCGQEGYRSKGDCPAHNATGVNFVGLIPDNMREAMRSPRKTAEQRTQEATGMGIPDDVPLEEIEVHRILSITKLLGGVIGGAVFPQFSKAASEAYEEDIKASLTDESVNKFLTQLGTIPDLMRLRFRLDGPIEDY